MTAGRFIATVAMLVMLAACASTPATPGGSSAATGGPASAPAPTASLAGDAGKAAPAATSAPATGSGSGPGDRPPPGYKAKSRKGETLWCRTEEITGSRFGRELCWTPEELQRMLENNETEVFDLFRKQPACGMQGCT